jgi:DNA-binding FadR family transcriptional regulator
VLLAAERAAPAELDRLAPLTDRMEVAADFEDYRRADVRFHIGIAEATGSARLVAAMTEVQGQMSDLIARIAHPKQVLTSSNNQHRRLIELLRRRDGDAAVRVIRQHIEGTEHILAGLLPR